MCSATKKTALKAVAQLGKAFANLGGGSISLFGYHQPKEPAMLKKALRK